jgi:uncharacterized membrane protein YciS (DUF1049 family)
MHGPINVKSPNNISKWQMGFNSAFKGLMSAFLTCACLYFPVNKRQQCANRDLAQQQQQQNEFAHRSTSILVYES